MGHRCILKDVLAGSTEGGSYQKVLEREKLSILRCLISPSLIPVAHNVCTEPLMRIDLFKLNFPEAFDLADRLQSIYCLEHEKRNRERNKQIIRLEALEKENDLWFCDFVKVRMEHGPGKAGLRKPITGFDLAEDEGFGEETGLLWDASTNYCAVQYNHFGPRDSLISEYLTHWDSQNVVPVNLLPQLDEKIHSKLKSKKIVRKFTLACAPKKLSDEDFNNQVPLTEGIKRLSETDADLVTVTVSVRGNPKKRLDLDLTKITNWLSKMSGAADEYPVSVARATARGEGFDTSEVFDLLHHKITTDKKIAPGLDKRYSMKDRWACLRAAFYEWKPIISA